MEILFRMMLLLILDIFQCPRQHGLADRKCSITTLPSKMFISIIDSFDPSAAISFHLFHKMRNGFGF